ncbi:hypothetical protein GQ602_007306 [Ophiocordyceps camponoti-floridani]|uniref:Uncharacterized protein n=1 Tax=Ophiocordyceps camponoti-floridani TaxID=2030778 RepID=A0A8H4Q101_9HYPO|nr:hypothetical protein GQ602_007306 [Ophiocordyceps camponoti-floridani]
MGSSSKYRGPAKRRLYLQHPEPDVLVSRSRITRVIPPSPPPPPPCFNRPPTPVIVDPPPPKVCEPPPVVVPHCPDPPRLPEPKPDPPIEVIYIEPSLKPHRSRSRSRSHSHHRERRDKEVYVERDRYIPVPVPVEPRYETYRYVEGPRRSVPSPPPPPVRRPAIGYDEREHIHINVDDHRRSRDYNRR